MASLTFGSPDRIYAGVGPSGGFHSLHVHWNLLLRHVFGQVQVGRNPPLQLDRLVFGQVVLGDQQIEFLNLPAGHISRFSWLTAEVCVCSCPLCHRDLAVHQQGKEPVAQLGELHVLSKVILDLGKQIGGLAGVSI